MKRRLVVLGTLGRALLLLLTLATSRLPPRSPKRVERTVTSGSKNNGVRRRTQNSNAAGHFVFGRA